eukprot:CAMPEP_0177360106 /NCGR_PEP_ID=MMETSP0368-20130122/36471_1 /TAXON_ID=447022 ORGANISM="Scrippsiella hangoei-like, Strain SHHI-4" /NCGR_SAMPLE_ID=MMETSP0368 /ASSEMBLY_ACC=CAM_ASM_000363 /LENGTH=186 /DNA_ID=CAMNT_0018822661 /DNA_START=588 /DNA_END=1149 /DNA_ORIENTATION=-
MFDDRSIREANSLAGMHPPRVCLTQLRTPGCCVAELCHGAPWPLARPEIPHKAQLHGAEGHRLAVQRTFFVHSELHRVMAANSGSTAHAGKKRPYVLDQTSTSSLQLPVLARVRLERKHRMLERHLVRAFRANWTLTPTTRSVPSHGRSSRSRALASNMSPVGGTASCESDMRREGARARAELPTA